MVWSFSSHPELLRKISTSAHMMQSIVGVYTVRIDSVLRKSKNQSDPYSSVILRTKPNHYTCKTGPEPNQNNGSVAVWFTVPKISIYKNKLLILAK